jgi:hypothetical protein
MHYRQLPSISSPLSLHHNLRITHLVIITSANSHHPNSVSTGFLREDLSEAARARPNGTDPHRKW